MRLLEKDDLYLIEDFFPENVTAGFTKTSLEGRDVKKDVSDALGSLLERDIAVSFMKQAHSCGVHSIDQAGIYECDALFTKESGLALVVKTADCLPLFVYDEKSGSAGAVHMGWRSAKEGILDNIGIDLASAKVLAGVAMRRCCFEVTGEFLGYRDLSPFVNERGGKLYFDPVGFARSSLAARGIDRDKFADLDICTLCDERDFFSFRRDKTQNRMMSFIIKR
ncbi:MAG: polyphenol oxidase family protein [Candidatus Omnitrophica bacterium]|nr:polyphenol oxidase family protein [Candidatus Omnitrophota bacterium]